jgi:hypothetical protein
LNRGDLMRQLAALYAQTVTGFRKEQPARMIGTELREIKRQIGALEKRLMDL